MHLGLEGQNIAVLGSSQGIGRAIAEGFVAEGGRVRGFDRTPGDGLDTTVGDVTAFADVKAFADTFAAIDLVIFSVGAGSG